MSLAMEQGRGLPYCLFQNEGVRIIWICSENAAFVDLSDRIPMAVTALQVGERMLKISGEPGVWARFEYVSEMEGKSPEETAELLAIVKRKVSELVN